MNSHIRPADPHGATAPATVIPPHARENTPRRSEGFNLLDGTNPVARIAALAIFTTPLFISIDLVSATVAVGFTVLFAWLCRTPVKELLYRGIPIFIALPFSGLSMALYGRPEGTSYFRWGWIHVTDNSLVLAAAIMIRILAVAFPAIIFLRHMDPADLGDGLAQVAKLPNRFVIGAVAAFRLGTLFTRDWKALGRSRRSRGLSDDGALVRFSGMFFALLVVALRRGGKLATAMEARGFGAPGQRSFARISRLHGRDWLLMFLAATAAAVSIGVAVATGYFKFLGV
ncbi:energy-coupling factor transporter transmembrane component T family protein [Corynebacterium mendelii]|uniref:Energy-coupling factor transporter transmembrane protein EcfT n=1 Tax=Corynebacterium mendelii TaxID=2765362 RepID=A0A939IY75_9CORY|nr:energy-coupling factor transporter transmembrane component T [Corynebacterium mendelii]MBN9644828.1 energy-coupling factor transporter transmembrane protein EcfT [Corynebacterium mendelii]